jgi:hypothetical protein
MLDNAHQKFPPSKRPAAGLGKDRASRPAKTIRSADGAQARGLSRRDARRPTIFFKIAADKDLALIRAQHLKKGRLEKTEASEIRDRLKFC